MQEKRKSSLNHRCLCFDWVAVYDVSRSALVRDHVISQSRWRVDSVGDKFFIFKHNIHIFIPFSLQLEDGDYVWQSSICIDILFFDNEVIVEHILFVLSY